MVLVGVEEGDDDDGLRKGFSQCIAPASLGIMTCQIHNLYQTNYPNTQYNSLTPPV